MTTAIIFIIITLGGLLLAAITTIKRQNQLDQQMSNIQDEIDDLRNQLFG